MAPKANTAKRTTGKLSRALLADAARAAEDLEAIRGVLREAAWRHAREYRVPLTPPQVHALQILVDELRGSAAGLSLSELSRRMGLAHSTVSGIVTRLEARNLVTRTASTADRRYVSIELVPPVKGWLERDLPNSRVTPLAAALAAASREDRQTILHGLAALRALLSEHQDRRA